MEGRPEGLVTGDLLVVGVILVAASFTRGTSRERRTEEVCVVAWSRGHLVPPGFSSGPLKEMDNRFELCL